MLVAGIWGENKNVRTNAINKNHVRGYPGIKLDFPSNQLHPVWGVLGWSLLQCLEPERVLLLAASDLGDHIGFIHSTSIYGAEVSTEDTVGNRTDALCGFRSLECAGRCAQQRANYINKCKITHDKCQE